MNMPTHAVHLPGDLTPALARLFGERTALRQLGPAAGTVDKTYNYRELAEEVGKTAAALAALGVEPKDRVCILAKNRAEFVTLLFACARLGALFVPLNWRLTASELTFLVEDAEPKVLLFDAGLAFLAGGLVQQTPAMTAVALDRIGEASAASDEEEEEKIDAPLLADLVAQASTIPEQAPVTADDPWLILYTSGTTGHPKGALLPYRQVLANAFNTQLALDLTGADSTVTFTPFFHTGALHVLTTPLLLRGGTVSILEGFVAPRILEEAAQGRCSILFGVPTTFEMMANAPAFADADFSAVRLALCGGAPCPLSLIERYTERGVVFKQGYGLTEVGPNCLNLNPEDVVRKAGSAGRENALIIAKRADDGELLLAGPCTCLGYWRRPDASADAFTADGFFRTGDIVEVDDEGFFSIVDRKKDMFISGGENVYPAEVERTLADHPDVGLVAVIGVPHEKWGEVGRAYVEVRANVGPDFSAALQRWAKERLAGFKVPKEVVVVDALPKNASGKVQKHLLHANAEATENGRAAGNVTALATASNDGHAA